MRKALFVLGSMCTSFASSLTSATRKALGHLFPYTSANTDQQYATAENAWLEKSIRGRIIFDSNRSGTFAIYSMKPDGSDVRMLSSSPTQASAHDMYPDASSTGDKVVFARAEHTGRSSPSDLYIMGPDGSDLRQLLQNGTFPTFIANNTAILFERERRLVMKYDLASGTELELFPRGHKEFTEFEISKPRLSADEKYLYFISDKGGRWNVWGVELEPQRVFWVGKGCEPTPSTDGKRVYWITKKSFFGRTGVAWREFEAVRSEGQNGTRPVASKFYLEGTGPERGYKYFPSLSQDGKFMLFSSGDGSEWTHTQAKYQIYIKDLQTGRCARLTNDGYCNRWPRVVAV